MAETQPLNRPHSSSISSVHFALPPARRLASSGSGLAYETITTPRNTDSFQFPAAETDPSTHSTPPPKLPPNADRRASAASVLKGKRASVVTGGYESSSGEDAGGARVVRPRATTIALPASTPSPQRLSASRHSSRDILRSSVFRPVNASSSSSRSLASPSKQAKRDVSPSKRKGKERAEPRRDLLAGSLGLASGASGPSLTSDQINSLLADSDVATAIRYMGTPVPAVSAEPHQPFLVSAPPALILDHSRSRTISMSTTASSPRQNTDRRRRASSRAIDEGGHVPFTHHVTPLALESDDGEETEPAAAIDKGEPVKSLPPPKKRKRISALFGLKHKSSDSSIRTETPSLVSIPTDTDEKIRRETLMKEKERQRRLDEIEEERYFHALQQVSAHPHSILLADQAKVHLWAFYEHVFDGVENPPRYNPVAILRWKHKVQEQEAARLAWNVHRGVSVESLTPSGGDPFSRWTFSLDDIERYKETEGHIDYFIPPVVPIDNTTKPIVSERFPTDELSNGSHSVRAVSNPSATSMERPSDRRQSLEPLSRTPSNEPNRFRRTHRTHQSLGHLGAISMAHKISSMARRQRTLPMGDVSDSTMDDSPLRIHHPIRSKTDRFLRRQPDPRGFVTDEEVVVEPKPQPVPVNLPVLALPPSEENAKRETRQKESYAERAKKLRNAQARLQHVDAALAIVDDNIKHYGARLRQVQLSAEVATGVSPSSHDRLKQTAHRISDLSLVVDEMENVKFDAAAKLRGMVKTINRMQSKTSEVDKWARKSALEIEELKRARARLLARRDKEAFWLRRGLDWYYNIVARGMAIAVRVSYNLAQYPFRYLGLQRMRHNGRQMTRWEQAWYVIPTWTFIGVMCIFYMVGGWAD